MLDNFIIDFLKIKPEPAIVQNMISTVTFNRAIYRSIACMSLVQNSSPKLLNQTYFASQSKFPPQEINDRIQESLNRFIDPVKVTEKEYLEYSQGKKIHPSWDHEYVLEIVTDTEYTIISYDIPEGLKLAKKRYTEFRNSNLTEEWNLLSLRTVNIDLQGIYTIVGIYSKSAKGLLPLEYKMPTNMSTFICVFNILNNEALYSKNIVRGYETSKEIASIIKTRFD